MVILKSSRIAPFLLIFLTAAFAHDTGALHHELTYAIAFLGGLLIFFAPCSYALVPAYFAVAFREKSQLIKHTSLFFIGFVVTFSLLWMTVSFISSFLNNAFLLKISGVLFVLFAIMALFGKSFSFGSKQTKLKTHWDVLLFGAMFSLGFAGCIGPVFLAILVLLANLPFLQGFLFIFFYVLGIFTPLFIMSYFFDRMDFSRLRWINRPLFSIRNLEIRLWNLLSFLLFFIIGISFLVSGSTSSLEPDLGINRSIYDVVYGIQDRILEMGISDAWIVATLFTALAVVSWKFKRKIISLFS